MGCVAGVGPYRWSKAGQLLLALALRFSSGLVPLLYLLLYLCLKPPTHKHVFSTCHEGHHNNNNNNNKPLKEVIQRQRLRYENQVTKGNCGFTMAPFVCVCRAPDVGYRWEDKERWATSILAQQRRLHLHVAAESGSLTHSSCRVCGAPCLPSCCSPVSSGSVPDRCTSSGSAHGTPPAATTERSALKSSVENEHGVFCCCRFNYCTDSYYYSLPDTLCYGSPII